MKNPIYLLFFLIVFFLNFAEAERIGLPTEVWKILKTEHFDIIFTAQQQELGLYYANQAEKAYENLATVFVNRPERVIIIVNDTTDISNGYATRIPYAHIMAYTVPIGDQESLSESGEWGRELITHELTHIMQFEPALGAFKYIRPVFGTIVAPNLLMPLWWKEGMAVEMESQFSPQGRSRSLFQDASLRAFVIDRKLFDYKLPQVNEVLPSWPYGARPYLFGSVFWSSFVRDSSLSAVNSVVARQGERVPYMIEEPLHEIVNRNYEAQYTKALTEVEAQANQQILKLNQQPLSEIQLLKINGQNAYGPRWSTEQQLLAVVENIDGESTLSLFNEKQERLQLKNLPKASITGIDIHPSAKKILYSHVDDLNSKYKVSDLYVYDIEKQKSDRLTVGQRAREASYSADGQKIVYISTFDGKTQVKILDLPTNKIETISTTDYKNRYISPLFWTPNEILVTKRDSSGHQKLYSVQLATKKESLVNLKYENIRFIRKKNSQLFFTSSENGVHNIYVTSNLNTATALTHVPTGVWSFDVDTKNNQAWATHMTSEGFQVGKLNLTKRSPLPVIENKLASGYKYKEKEQTDITYVSEDYKAAGYLIPRYWIPYVATSSTSRGVFFQAQTSGHDPINKHEYSLLANYDTDLQRAGFQGLYLNSTMETPFQLLATSQNQAFGDATNVVETKTASFGLLPNLFNVNKNLSFQYGAEFQQTDYFGSKTQHWGPYALTTFVNYSQNIFQISPEHGWGGYLKYSNMQNISGSRDYNKAQAAVVGYFSPWLPRHHAIMARVSTLLTFESVPARFGTSNSSLFFNSDLVLPQFILRGYLPSQFYGRSLWNTNLEYRFPIKKIEKGSGTDAYFLKRISGAIVTDGLGVEGGSVTEKSTFERRTLNESFWSSGIEFKLETTIGYVLPVNFILGAYLPYSPQFSSSVQTGVSVQIGGF